jgi:hypothetical protein
MRLIEEWGLQLVEELSGRGEERRRRGRRRKRPG